MKAVLMHSLGGPRQLVYEEVEKPLLDPGDALIRVIATSITLADRGMTAGPAVPRSATGQRDPG